MNPSSDEPVSNPAGFRPERPSQGKPKKPSRRGGRAGRGVPSLRKPDARRFAVLKFNLPSAFPDHSNKSRLALTGTLIAGILIGAFFPKFEPPEKKNKVEVVTLAPEPPPKPAPPRPPPPDPAPPKPPPIKLKAPEPPPPPQFGLQKEALAEKSELAVAAGNTIMKPADSIAKPPPPPLPAEPEMLDHAVRRLSGPTPVYPPRANERGLEATVVFVVTIDTLGRVTEAHVQRSGGSEFDQAGYNAVIKTRFEAPIRNGRRISSRFLFPMEFRLEE